jgi:PKD repeat protein
VSLSANPTFGGARLTVNFIGKGRDLDGIIRQMELNFGDGQHQTSDVANGPTNQDTSMSTSYTYTQPGTYIATLRVKDNSGQGNEWSSTPESCKVKIEVQGVILAAAATTTNTTTTATELPKSGVSDTWFLVSSVVSGGLGLLIKWKTRG